MFFRRKNGMAPEPMPKKQLQKIIKSFKRNGGIIYMSEEVDAHLQNKEAEGATLNENTILLRSNPSRSTVFEELIHATQFKNGENDGSPLSVLKNEIMAQKKLLKYSKAYGLTKLEIIQTQKALREYEKELRKLRKEQR